MKLRKTLLFISTCLTLFSNGQSNLDCVIKGKLNKIKTGRVTLFNACITSKDSIASSLIINGEFELKTKNIYFSHNVGRIKVNSDTGDVELNLLVILENNPIHIDLDDAINNIIYKGTTRQDSMTYLMNEARSAELKIEEIGENIVSEKEYQVKIDSVKVRLKLLMLTYLNNPNFDEIVLYTFNYFKPIFENEKLFKAALCAKFNEKTGGCFWIKEACYLENLKEKSSAVMFNYITNQSKKTDTYSIKGNLKDKESGTRIAFVNCIVKGTMTGTMTDEIGFFELQYNSKNLNDTIIFSCLGYEQVLIPLNKLIKGENNTIYLTPMPTILNEVIIEERKGKMITLGVSHRAIAGGGVAYSSDTVLGTQVAYLIEIEKKKSIFIEKVKVHFYSNGCNRFPMRVHLYSQNKETGLPKDEMLNENEIFYVNVSKGWVEINLKKYNVIAKENFFICIEWLDNNDCQFENRPFISVKARIKTPKTYYKLFGTNTWQKAPQNYVMNVSGRLTK